MSPEIAKIHINTGVAGVMRLDELDGKIVRLLQEDARLSYREIAERLGSTNPTISARVKALEDIGLLRGYRAELDHSVLGGTSCLLTLTARPSAAEFLLSEIRGMEGVHSVLLLADGRIVAHIHLRPPTYGLAHLHKAIASLLDVLTYDASEVIASHESTHLTALPENVAIPCHQCKGPVHEEPVKRKFGNRMHVFCCRQCFSTFRERYESLQGAASSRASSTVNRRSAFQTESDKARNPPRHASVGATRAPGNIMSHQPHHQKLHEHGDAHTTIDTPGATHDPVCGHWVVPEKAHEASLANGRTIHFCSVACKRAFDREPAKFLARLKTS